jgi:predicted nucleic acid-binding Zn ribbon protein
MRKNRTRTIMVIISILVVLSMVLPMVASLLAR